MIVQRCKHTRLPVKKGRGKELTSRISVLRPTVFGPNLVLGCKKVSYLSSELFKAAQINIFILATDQMTLSNVM